MNPIDVKIKQIYKCALKDGDQMASDENKDRYVIAAFFKGCSGIPVTWDLYKSGGRGMTWTT